MVGWVPIRVPSSLLYLSACFGERITFDASALRSVFYVLRVGVLPACLVEFLKEVFRYVCCVCFSW